MNKNDMLCIGDIASKIILEDSEDMGEALRHTEDAESGVDESLLDEIRNYLDTKGADIDKEMKARQAAGEDVWWAVPATDGIIQDLKEFGMNGIKSLEDFKASEAASEYSDAYKSANGFRPRDYHWSDNTADEWDKIIDDLYKQARTAPDEEEPYEHNNSEEPVNKMVSAFSAIGESTSHSKPKDYEVMARLYTEGVQSSE